MAKAKPFKIKGTRSALFASVLFVFWFFPFSFVFSQGENLDYSKFLHTSQRHASIGCANCHHRADNSSRPSFPGHKDCFDCHKNQVLTQNTPMCFICHSDTNGSDPPRKSFPDKFKERFNVKFDHAQHMSGAAKPKNGCSSCHGASLQRGMALSIPTGIDAHEGCYTCHTPDANSNGREIASCGVCHDQKAYSRTSTDSRAYRVGFKHVQHSGRQGLGCANCHKYTAGLPQKRQVSSPRVLEHFPVGNNTCATCHSGRRSFGDLDFKSCRRCHTGQTFRTGT